MSEINLQDYKLYPESGFIPKIPDFLPEYFLPWHELALKAIDLMEKKMFREEADKLAQLDSSKLQDYLDLRLAHLQLSIIAAAYAWQDGVGNGPKSLPAHIAVPLCDVSDRLGVESGQAACSLTVNVVTKDGDVRLRYKLPGGQMAVLFWKANYDVEMSLGKFVPVISNILEGTKARNKDQVTQALKDLAKWVGNLKDLIKAYTRFLTPEKFAYQVMPFYTGFHGYSGYPDGMLYEGVTHNPRRKTVNTSAAQNASVPIVEAILGVTYSPEKAGIKESWRQAWPAVHRKLYQIITNWPVSVRSMAQEDTNSDLAKTYDDVLKAFHDFRANHVEIVTRYVVNPLSNPKTASNGDGEQGATEESPVAGLIPMLKGFRAESFSNRLDSSA